MCKGPAYLTVETLGGFEWYRYDALGRRVLSRVRRDHNCTNASACSSTLTRFVWDGDQILYEIQAQGGEVSAAALENDDTYGNQYGRVLYTHGPGIDAPLDIIRMRHTPPAGYGFEAWGGPYPVLPFGDWRGTFVGGTTAQGVRLPCDATYCLVAWPGKRYRAFLERDRPVHQQNFFGSLTTGQENSNGLMYMRNRYYNPLTGAFTQTDPIGLAGGLNTYGYANGNPVTYSDPYGLKADSIPKVWRDKLGDMCDQIDCTQANIVTTGFMAGRIPDGYAMTLGNNMYFGRAPNPNNPNDVALVAHELTHVGDFQNQPALLSVAEVVATRWYDLTGISPYRWQQYPLGSFYEYNLESRGQIVQDCFSGRSEVACHISIYKPNNWDPSKLYGP